MMEEGKVFFFLKWEENKSVFPNLSIFGWHTKKNYLYGLETMNVEAPELLVA